MLALSPVLRQAFDEQKQADTIRTQKRESKQVFQPAQKAEVVHTFQMLEDSCEHKTGDADPEQSNGLCDGCILMPCWALVWLLYGHFLSFFAFLSVGYRPREALLLRTLAGDIQGVGAIVG